MHALYIHATKNTLDHGKSVGLLTALRCNDFQTTSGTKVRVGWSQPSRSYGVENPLWEDELSRTLFVVGKAFSSDSMKKTPEKVARLIVQVGNKILDDDVFSPLQDVCGVYAMAALDRRNNRLVVYCDPSGILRLYYGGDQTKGWVVSTHSRAVAETLGARADNQGMVEYLALGYGIGRRTLFEGVHSVQPGERVVFDLDRGMVCHCGMTELYGSLVRYKSCAEAGDALFETLMEGSRGVVREELSHGLLLSGGFDSRLVAALLSQGGRRLKTVTFGDTDSKEVRIAQNVARTLGCDDECWVPRECFKVDEMQVERLCKAAESCSFPGMEAAAQRLQAMGAQTASTGFLGETVYGGQGYGVLDGKGATRARWRRILKRLCGLHNVFEIPWNRESRGVLLDAADDYHRRRILRFMGRLTPELKVHAEDALRNLREELDVELRRLEGSNPETMPQVAERFHLEHHVRHFGGQERTLGSVLGIVLPTVYPKALRLGSNLSPGLKADHGCYLQMVRRHLGSLARIPTGTFPFPLTWPESLLWVGRAVRQLRDQRIVEGEMRGRGHTDGRLRSGWANFEVWLREISFCDRVEELLDGSILDRNAVKVKMSRIRNWEEKIYSGIEWLDALGVQFLTRKMR